MKQSSITTTFGLLAAALILSAPAEAKAQSDLSQGIHSGWLGFFGGPTFGTDDEAILWRAGLRGGAGVRFGSLAVDLGLALDAGYAKEEQALDSMVSSRHIEVVPFARAMFLLSDSLSLYAGAGLGYAHVQTKIDMPILGTTTSNSSGMLFRLMAGVELAMNEEIRLFFEPLGLNSYRFDEASSELFSVLVGVGSVF